MMNLVNVTATMVLPLEEETKKDSIVKKETVFGGKSTI